MKAKLTVITVAVIVLITAGAFWMARSAVNSRVVQAVDKQLKSSFSAVWQFMELDADSVVRQANRFSALYRKPYHEFALAQQQLSDTLTQKVAAVPESKRPDLAVILVKGRVLAATAAPDFLPEKKESRWLQNRRLDAAIAKTIFTQEVKRKDGAPATKLVPEGWTAPKIQAGTLPKGKLFRQDAPTALAVPFVVVLDKKNRPSPTGVPKRLGVLLLGWKTRQNPADVRDVALGLAGDEELRHKHFLMAYGRLRVHLAKMIFDMEDDLRAQGKIPEFVGLVDVKGILLHRNKQTEYLVGESLAARKLSLQTSLSRSMALSDIWLVQDLVAEEKAKGKKKKSVSGSVRSSLLRVGLAPIYGDTSEVIGAVCLGWSLSDKAATDLHNALGVDVVFLEGDRFAASSATLGSVDKDVLSKVKGKRVETKKISKVEGTVEWEDLKGIPVTVGGKRYLAAAGVLAGARQAGSYTYMVFVSYEKALQPFGMVPWIIIGAGLLLLIFALVAQAVLWRHFIKPIDEIYTGVNEFIAGDMEYTFGVPSAETEGLCYALNSLLAKLLGRPEPGDEEEEEGEGPEGVTLQLGELPAAAVPATDPSVAHLAGEPEGAYYQRLFNEYKAALEAEDEYTEDFAIEDFMSKLQVNERVLKMRFECRMVRFRVEAGPEGTVLTPVPIQ